MIKDYYFFLKPDKISTFNFNLFTYITHHDNKKNRVRY